MYAQKKASETADLQLGEKVQSHEHNKDHADVGAAGPSAGSQRGPKPRPTLAYQSPAPRLSNVVAMQTGGAKGMTDQTKQRRKRRTYTRATAIYAYCLECSGGNRAEVRRCVIPDCPLYPFRCRGVRKGLGRVKTPVGQKPVEKCSPESDLRC